MGTVPLHSTFRLVVFVLLLALRVAGRLVLSARPRNKICRSTKLVFKYDNEFSTVVGHCVQEVAFDAILERAIKA